MKKIFNAMKSLWKDESAQGATEYILLLVVVVTLAFIFRGKIEEAVRNKMSDVSSGISGFGINQQ